MAEKLNLPFHLKEVDLPRMKSDAGKGNLEALARVVRYRFFADMVKIVVWAKLLPRIPGTIRRRR